MEHEGGEEANMLEELKGVLGEDIIAQVLSEDAPLTAEDYKNASANLSEAQITLVDNVAGYQAYMRQNLAAAYGQDDETVDEEAWTATWKKVKDLLGGDEGTLLAETAQFFDAVARKTFGKNYKPMEKDSGPTVSADVCAKTFYIVMEDHLPRAIIGAN